MTTPTYEPERYWGELVGGDFTLRGVGYPELSLSFNAFAYRAMVTSTERVLAQAGVDGKELRVLDLGCGTGVWVDFWHRRGAAEVAGLDLTESSVANLRERFPGDRFEQANISEPGIPDLGAFDVVSAMNVLLHVTDEAGFERAIANVAGALGPDGAFVVMDPIVVHQWWGPPIDERSPARPRPLARWDEVLARHGLEITERVPVTCLLANAVDTRRRLSFRALILYWLLVIRLIGQRERLGKLAGRVLHALDRLALRLVSDGPSAKVVVIRRKR